MSKFQEIPSGKKIQRLHGGPQNGKQQHQTSTICMQNFDAMVCFILMIAVAAEFFSMELISFFNLLTLQIQPKFLDFSLLLPGTNAQAKLYYPQPTYRKPKNVDLKSNGPLNFHIPKDYSKCQFFVAHPIIFQNKKKMPILMTFRLVLGSKSQPKD